MVVTEADDQLPKFSRALTAHQPGYEFLAVIVTSVRSCSAGPAQSNNAQLDTASQTGWAVRRVRVGVRAPDEPSLPRWRPGRAGSASAARTGPGTAQRPPRRSPPPLPALLPAWTSRPGRHRSDALPRRAPPGRAGPGRA